MAHAGGRPTIYSEEILTKTKEYIASCVSGYSNVGTEEKPHIVFTVKVPTIEALSLHLGITRDTIYEWESQDDKKEFSYIIKDLRAKQADSLIQHGLAGQYNSTIAKVLLAKHGYREEHGLDVSGGLNIGKLLDEAEKKANE